MMKKRTRTVGDIIARSTSLSCLLSHSLSYSQSCGGHKNEGRQVSPIVGNEEKIHRTRQDVGNRSDRSGRRQIDDYGAE